MSAHLEAALDQAVLPVFRHRLAELDEELGRTPMTRRARRSALLAEVELLGAMSEAAGGDS